MRLRRCKRGAPWCTKGWCTVVHSRAAGQPRVRRTARFGNDSAGGHAKCSLPSLLEWLCGLLSRSVSARPSTTSSFAGHRSSMRVTESPSSRRGFRAARYAIVPTSVRTFTRARREIGAVVVVVRVPRGVPRPKRQRQLRSLQRLNLRFLVDAQHDGISRRVQIQTDNVAHLGYALPR
jgi:hypothetical protein